MDRTPGVLLASMLVCGAVAGTAAVVAPSPSLGASALPVVAMASRAAAQVEGNSGAAPLRLTVTLHPASTNTVSVHFATSDGTAKVAQHDYEATSDTLTFPAGTTVEHVDVQVVGDTTTEDYETFSVKLSSPTNAKLRLAKTTVTILNDDAPRLVMRSVTHVTAGQAAVFEPHLADRYYEPITLHAATADGTAKAGTDYTALDQDITFPAGSKVAVPASVPTNLETLPDGPERYSLTISGTGVANAVRRTATIDGTCTGAATPARYQHVVVVVMENKNYGNVVGSASAPFQTALAHACGTAKHYAAVSSPSRPNYIAMTSGDTYGCDGSDADPPGGCAPPSPSLFGQVVASGGTALTYAEAMTSNCQQVSSGLYATKHNPWAYYPGERALCLQYDQPMPASIDVSLLPTLLYLVPNLCNDSHNCSVATGDQWLQQELTPILGSAGFASGSTAVIVTYDEYTYLPNAFAARSVRPGKVVAADTSHYGLLRTIEDMLGLAHLGQAAASTSLRSAMHL